MHSLEAQLKLTDAQFDQDPLSPQGVAENCGSSPGPATLTGKRKLKVASSTFIKSLLPH